MLKLVYMLSFSFFFISEQVQQMGPLIDQELEKIDRRHAQLTRLGGELVEALNMYHNLMRDPGITPPPISLPYNMKMGMGMPPPGGVTSLPNFHPGGAIQHPYGPAPYPYDMNGIGYHLPQQQQQPPNSMMRPPNQPPHSAPPMTNYNTMPQYAPQPQTSQMNGISSPSHSQAGPQQAPPQQQPNSSQAHIPNSQAPIPNHQPPPSSMVGGQPMHQQNVPGLQTQSMPSVPGQVPYSSPMMMAPGQQHQHPNMVHHQSGIPGAPPNQQPMTNMPPNSMQMLPP